MLNNNSELQGLKVLVVDDDIDTCELISVCLELYGTKVETATSVNDALERFAELQPDVLISDIAMPEQDGYALILQIRSSSSPKQRQVPAVAITAFADKKTQQDVLAAGFQKYLSKPVEPDQLVETVACLAACG